MQDYLIAGLGRLPKDAIAPHLFLSSLLTPSCESGWNFIEIVSIPKFSVVQTVAISEPHL